MRSFISPIQHFIFIVSIILSSASFSVEQKITANDAAAGDDFGETVSIHQDVAVVSANEAVYVFTRTNNTWSQHQKIVASDAQPGDQFGASIDIGDNLLVIGATGVGQHPTSHLGAIYVFEENGSGNWAQSQKIMANDGDAYDRLGSSVAIHGDTILSGATNDDDNGSNSGAVYAFSKDNLGDWYQSQKFTPADNIEADFFGNALDVDGDTLIVGAYGAKANVANWTGAAYVFGWNGNTWEETQKIVASDAAADDLFGASVSISNNNLIIGAKQNETNQNNSGAAYIFSKTNGSWAEAQKLTASDSDVGEFFGSSVSIDGDIAVIGAEGADHHINGSTYNNSGASYVFVRFNNSWAEQTKLTASDREGWDEFGSSVMIYNNKAIIGAPTEFLSASDLGGVYVYDVDSSPPHQDTPGTMTGLFTSTIQHDGLSSGLISATDVDGLTDGDYFSITVPAQNGSASIDALSGSWTYIPSQSYVGLDSFTVTLTDDLGGITQQVINIEVTASDGDNDGIYDFLDNCPNVSNVGQQDFDGDSVGDVCDDDIDGDGTDNTFDAFPSDPSETTDTDADTVGDNADNCVNDANTNQANLDGDALGDVCDPDMDGDGIANFTELRFGGNETDNTDASVSLDNVASFSETAPTDADNDGVPDDIETAVGGDPANAADAQSVIAFITGMGKNVPAMGGIGLLALGLSMLGLGSIRLRKK